MTNQQDESMNQTAAFKYTFPIAKSETRSDGNYLIGFASGPEVDSEQERMAPDAILGFADQINSSTDGNRLVYRDAHAPDGVLRDLGEITKAWVNEKMHLGIEVRLDMANPASQYLWEQVQKGKQYGMSVAGRVMDYVDEFASEIGSVVRTYKRIALDEISNTTRPAWYPSFGSVLAKSIKDAEETEVEKAVWTTAYVNNLPDSAFAYIEGGGKKDADGKTTPRSLRHFPYKDASGKVDAAHVRNGLARLSQSSLSDSAKASAKAKLVAAAKQVGIQVSEKSATTDDIGENTLSDEVLLDDTVKGDEAKSDTAESSTGATVKKFSSSAEDASEAAEILSDLLDLLGEESGPDDAPDADKIRAAIAALQSFITDEAAEVGTPEDQTESDEDPENPENNPMAAMMSDTTETPDLEKSDDLDLANAEIVDETGESDEEDAEKSDVDESDVAKAGRKVSAETAQVITGVYQHMKKTMTHMEDAMGNLGILDGNPTLDGGDALSVGGVTMSSTKSAETDEEDTVEKSTEQESVDELTTLKAQIDELTSKYTQATARIEELENSPSTSLPPLINDDVRRSAEADFEETLKKASPSERLRLAFAANTRGR